jgi:hypothetical protein
MLAAIVPLRRKAALFIEIAMICPCKCRLCGHVKPSFSILYLTNRGSTIHKLTCLQVSNLLLPKYNTAATLHWLNAIKKGPAWPLFLNEMINYRS